MSLLESTVGGVAAADLDACTFFDAIGFDFAEDGWQTVAAACDAHDVDPSWVESELHRRGLGARCDPCDLSWGDIDRITSRVVSSHHASLRAGITLVGECLLRLAAKADAEAVCGETADRFSRLAAVLATHFDKEENILFPAFNALAESRRHGTPVPSLPFPTVLYPIRVMEAEHERVECELGWLLATGANSCAELQSTAAWMECQAALNQLGRRLRAHARFENDWLFPRALELERSLS